MEDEAPDTQGKPFLMRKPRPPSESYLNAPLHFPPPVKKTNGKSPDVNNASSTPDELCNRCNFTIHPLHPKGPPFLPPSKIIRSQWYEPVSDVPVAPPPPLFTLNDFLQNSDDVKYLKSRLERAAISRDNYLKMTGWFATQLPTHNAVTVKELQVDHLAPSQRKPHHQMLLEFQAMLHDVVDDSPVNDYTATDNGIAMDTTALLVATTGESASTSMEATFYSSRVNRTQGLYESPPGVAREHRNEQGINRDITTTEPEDRSFQHTAITVEPTETSLNHRDRHPSASTVRCQDRYPSASTMVSGEDVYIQSSRSRIFCGQDRSSSPFDPTFEATISPGEVAILQCMVVGDLQPLSRTLTHINLSYNDLEVFPVQLLVLNQLEILHMRNNPLREIPSTINILKKLKVFSIPFNLLSDLPPGLFDLRELEELDVSHNKLQYVSPDIGGLSMLEKLDLSYNQLSGVPVAVASLCHLSHLKVDSNYTHPLLWRENTNNTPQSLNDLCCHVIYTNIQDVPPHIQHIMERSQKEPCNSCKKLIFGTGLRLIRSLPSRYQGCKTVPFIFHVCSVECYATLKKADLTQLLGLCYNQ